MRPAVRALGGERPPTAELHRIMLDVMRRNVRTWRLSGRHPGLVRALGALYRAGRELRTLVTLPLVVIRLRRSRAARDPEALVDLAFNGFGRAITPFQVPQEILGLTRLASNLRPKRVLEIGTARGGTLFLLTRASADDAHVISVDLPGGWFGGGYPRWKAIVYRAFARPGQRLDLIRADSHAQGTLERVRSLLGGEPLDLLMIDGDHTYHGAKRDFEAYSTLVRPDGIVAMHDIVPNTDDPGIEVDRLWVEIKDGRGFREIVADPRQNGAGIGVIRV